MAVTERACVMATVQALADPLYGYHGPATSTGGSAVFMLVNGPIARELDINCENNLFGPGWRSNATLGRAVRRHRPFGPAPPTQQPRQQPQRD